jgi:hypothetical protein
MLVVLTLVLFQTRVRTHDPRLSGVWLVTVGERAAGNLTAEQVFGAGSPGRTVWYFRPDGTGGKSNSGFVNFDPFSRDQFKWWIQGDRLHIDENIQEEWGWGMVPRGILGTLKAAIRRLLGDRPPRHPEERYEFNVEDGKTIRLQLVVEEDAAPMYLSRLKDVPALPVSGPVEPVPAPAVRARQ